MTMLIGAYYAENDGMKNRWYWKQEEDEDTGRAAFRSMAALYQTADIWLTLIRNTKTQGFWRKHKKTDWNYHITQKAVLENGAVFLRDMARVHWGPPCFGYQGGPQQTPALPPEKSELSHGNFETKCPKGEGVDSGAMILIR